MGGDGFRSAAYPARFLRLEKGPWDNPHYPRAYEDRRYRAQAALRGSRQSARFSEEETGFHLPSFIEQVGRSLYSTVRLCAVDFFRRMVGRHHTLQSPPDGFAVVCFQRVTEHLQTGFQRLWPDFFRRLDENFAVGGFSEVSAAVSSSSYSFSAGAADR